MLDSSHVTGPHIFPRNFPSSEVLDRHLCTPGHVKWTLSSLIPNAHCGRLQFEELHWEERRAKDSNSQGLLMVSSVKYSELFLFILLQDH